MWSLKKNDTIMEMKQAKQNIRPRKDKKVKLRQVEGQARIPKLEIKTAAVAPPASVKGVTLPPLSVSSVI